MSSLGLLEAKINGGGGLVVCVDGFVVGGGSVCGDRGVLAFNFQFYYFSSQIQTMVIVDSQ